MKWKKITPVLIPVCILLACAVAYLYPDAFDVVAGLIACVGIGCMLSDAFRRK